MYELLRCLADKKIFDDLWWYDYSPNSTSEDQAGLIVRKNLGLTADKG